ncbi:MAG: hypothetical protein ABW168_17710, partial [Sedimenticola sp.]
IGQAVGQLPQVKRAATSGRMAIVGGTTTRYVVKALTDEDPGRDAFAVGWIKEGLLSESPAEGRGPGAYLFDQGEVGRGWPGELLQAFEGGDIYIKGANAVDPEGNAGILMAAPTGGTIGVALATLFARGAELIIPVSLQKLIPSIPAIGGLLGQGNVDRVMGSPVGYMPIMNSFATVITEIEAMHILFDVEAVAIAAGGQDDCSGSVTLHLHGTEEAIEQAWQAIQSLTNGGQ